MLSLKHRLRLARRIEAAWGAQPARRPNHSEQVVDSLDEQITSLRESSRRLTHARIKGWTSAGKELGMTFSRQLDALRNLTHGFAQAASAEVDETDPQPNWLAEIEQLEAEFGAIHIDWSRRCLIVNTEPITLEGIELGPFAIEFYWERLSRKSGSHCFDITAQEPNPSVCNEEVCHPHVRAGELCAGDAADPIESALAEGRLADAMLMVRSVLLTYNPHSPFVSLDHWSGTACHDCGTIEDPEELSYCEGCDADFCGSCFSSCTGCDRYRCLECLSRCDLCGSHCCTSCLEASEISDRDCCAECRTSCSICERCVANDEIVEGTDECAECDAAPENPTSTEETPTHSQETCHETTALAQPLALAPADSDFCPACVAEAPILLPSG